MIKINNFSFQGINGAYSELAGKNIFPEALDPSIYTSCPRI